MKYEYYGIWSDLSYTNSDTGYTYSLDGIDFWVYQGNYEVRSVYIFCEDDPHCTNRGGEYEAYSTEYYEELYGDGAGDDMKRLLVEALEDASFVSMANTTVSWCPMIKLDLRRENDEYILVPIPWDEDFTGFGD